MRRVCYSIFLYSDIWFIKFVSYFSDIEDFSSNFEVQISTCELPGFEAEKTGLDQFRPVFVGLLNSHIEMN